MSGLTIQDAAKQFGVTSKTLRYYERVGLLEAKRTVQNNYRYYDASEVERIKQIMILRKMQISIKDIIRIYENEDMRTVVEIFVERMNAIDAEVGALTELKRITNDFLQAMLNNGVTKISALPIIYEQMEKELDTLERKKTTSYTELAALSDKLAKLPGISIISLPSMRVLSSLRKNGILDADGFWRWVQLKRLPRGEPGRHELFEFQTDAGDVCILQVAQDFINDGDYIDYTFDGGLFAAASIYLDEDLAGCFRSLIRSFEGNEYYQIDYESDGSLRHAAMLENLISPDGRRELVSLLVPVKKRMADPELYEKPKEVTGVSIAEIEAANPVLWETEVQLDQMTQTHPENSHLHINSDGDVEFIGWIIRAVLNTHVSVKLPFRIDMEFRQKGSARTGIVFYHGEDTGYSLGYTGIKGFGVNMDNDNERMRQSLRFHQPVFLDGFRFPGRGAIKKNRLNRLTWIVGEKHLAIIMNGEIRYCGVNFPYMSLDLGREEARTVVIGAYGNDCTCFHSIRISQLEQTHKIKLKEGELSMMMKQSNNTIPVIHRLVTDEYGENYWFNGCARYVMECLGEKDYDYWFFAGLTGDLFTQHYSYTNYSGDALSSYRMEEDPAQYVEEIFGSCGYAATFVSNRDLRKNTEMYLQTLIAYIDRGLPVIVWGHAMGGLLGVFVGYEDDGKVLLYITANNDRPERVPLKKALEGLPDKHGWIFTGSKKEDRPLADIYREAIVAIPRHQRVQTESYCFGAGAFRAWARDIENGKFDGMKAEDFDTWAHYTNYLCVLATNDSCCHAFLKRARDLNPDMGYLEDVSALYHKMHRMEKSLDALGGGFNVTLAVLQNQEKRGKIAKKLLTFAECTDEVLRIIQQNTENNE